MSAAEYIRMENVQGLIRRLHREGRVDTEAAGELLLNVGVKRLKAHPDEEGIDTEEQCTWRDETGRVWPLNIKGEGVPLRDAKGDLWYWAGGLSWYPWPDKQPLLSRSDWSESDIPLCNVEAVVGPLQVEGG